jgi:hypothetical protein
MSRPEPVDAYKAAFDALDNSPVQGNENWQPKIARQIVDTLIQARAEHGLPWLRKIGTSWSYLYALNEISEQYGPRNADMVVGRVQLWEAYQKTAATFIAAYGRKKS